LYRGPGASAPAAGVAMLNADFVRGGPVVLVSRPQRNAGLGLLAALGFYCYIIKFSDRVLTYKTKKSGGGEGIRETVLRILWQTCGYREALTVTKLSLMLMLRTFGSVWVSRHWGKIVNSVVTANFPRLKQLVSEFAAATVALSVLNALLKFYNSTLRLQVREQITRWCHEMYLRPGYTVYYRANRVGEHRLENCDHQIASDVQIFSQVFTDVVSQSLKPTVDFIVYSVELSRVQGLATPLTLYAWFAIASCVSTWTLPPFGEIAATRQHLEGQFRARHSDLIAHCEQIAFLRGERPEKGVLNASLDRLLAHCRREHHLSFNSEIVRQYLNKYFVTVIGLFLVSRPLRLQRCGAPMPSYTSDQIAQYFSSTWRNMEAMATSIQDLFELADKVGTLSGLAARVGRLMAGLLERPPVLVRETEAALAGPHPPTFERGKSLKFEHVSVYKPDGTLLVKDLNFAIEPGQRVLITGANGCGKSSLFRVLCGLWPLVEGKITKPRDLDLHFVPQNVFVPVGTLRDVVIYPKSREEVEADGRTDKDVQACLKWAHVSPQVVADGRAQLEFVDRGVVVRPKLDEVRDWQKELSPGQKQRVAFARLFFHRPRIAVLDECTNGVSPDVEHDLYDRCAKLKLAVFSISHKIELKLFHDFELHYTGDAEGSWSMSRCSETRDKVTFSSALVRLPEPGPNGRTETKITYERHVWFVE